MLHPQVNTTLRLHSISFRHSFQKVFSLPWNDSDLLCSLAVLIWQVLNLESAILNKDLIYMYNGVKQSQFALQLRCQTYSWTAGM